MDLNLIRFFDFYLALTFLVGTALRVQQYRAALRLVRAVPARWPRLFDLVKQHRGVFLTWATVLPALVALALLAAQVFASNRVWPEAAGEPDGLTLARLLERPLAVPFAALFGVAMVGTDLYALFAVGEVNRAELEKSFDEAEYWLKSWKAPVVKFFTFGYVNPRQVVNQEVRAALVAASRMLNSTLWWLAVQTGLRIAFGLSLWLTYAWGRVA